MRNRGVLCSGMSGVLSSEYLISPKTTKLQRDKVIEAFNDLENFKYNHTINQDLDEIEDLIIE